MAIIGLLAAVIFVVIILSYRQETVTRQKNTMIQQHITQVTATAEKSLKELIATINITLDKFQACCMKIDKMELWITPRALKELISNRQKMYCKKIQEHEVKEQKQKKALFECYAQIRDFFLGIQDGKTRAQKNTKKRLKSRHEMVDVILYYLEENVDPLAFFRMDIGHLIGRSDSIVTPFDLFKDVVSKKIKDKDLLQQAQALIAEAETDLKNWSDNLSELNALRGESDELEEYLSNNFILATYLNSRG